MVDPMFMIVQTLTSFLTAVTPTAVTKTTVAPTLVICETRASESDGRLNIYYGLDCQDNLNRTNS